MVVMNAYPVAPAEPVETDQSEVAEWLEAFDQIIEEEGPSRAAEMLEALTRRARESVLNPPTQLNTPYKNTIPIEQELPYPGDREMESRVEALIRWNAMAMVHLRNKKASGIGGHLSTYSSLATLLEVGFNHFFHGSYGQQPGDLIYFQGHASPGVYARAFLEGRISENQVLNFRHETRGEPGLSSYPHPWLMLDFWSFPTVSMGIGPINAIYQARFMRYLENRNLIEKTPRKLWAYLVDGETDEPLENLHRGGHDPKKIYNGYLRAVEHKGGPTVILAKTVKGYGAGYAQVRNATHQEKKLTDEALVAFQHRFKIPVPKEAAKDGMPYRPKEDTPEIVYMKQRRKELGGFLPAREKREPNLQAPELEFFSDALGGSRGRAVSTTMGFVSMLRTLMKHPEIGKLIVPIVPDEGRTFGLESAIRQVGIYASQGQLYTPHDQDILLYYREERDGQILEEGITEAGSMASFAAAGTAYSNYQVPTIPFYMYYSMFGFQRVGDLIWAFGDARGKGFLMGGTAGRTTLSGEGLQHCDGHSVVMSSVYPNCITYDPAFAYEMAIIIQDGLRRMYQNSEAIYYYLTMYNEDYAMPEMPKGVEEGVLRGIYKYKAAPGGKAIVQLFGSGPILNEALKAQAILAEKYSVQADVWSVTSYTELRREALAADRWNRLDPAEQEKQQ